MSTLLSSLFGFSCGFLLCFLYLRFFRGKPVPSSVARLSSRRDRTLAAIELLSGGQVAAKQESHSGTANETRSDLPNCSQNDANHGEGEEEEEGEDEEWSTDEESDEEEDSDDSECERMESMRLKMVFVIRNDTKPKLKASEAATVTASAAVSLIEERNRPTDMTSLSEEERQFRLWYHWWNRLGCAKITLKCPRLDQFEECVNTAASAGLPMKTLDNSTGEALVLALGPVPAARLDPITGDLKLFS